MKRFLIIVAFVCLAVPVQAQILVKQSTATTVNGKLTKIADGTDHTGLTVTSITAKIIKHSDTTSSTVTAVTCAASGSANDCVEVAAGVYNMELSAGNTDTLGRLDVCMLASGDYTDCVRYEVVPSGYYDLAVTTGPTTAPTNFSLLAIDGSGRTDISKIAGQTASASGTVTFPPGTLASGLGSGTAQAGGTSTQIILAAAENYAVNDHPVGALVTILSGTGKGQSRVITAYTNSTDTATIDSAWITNPDATSVYAVVPFPALQTAATVSAAILNTALASYTTAGTVGERLNLLETAVRGVAYPNFPIWIMSNSTGAGIASLTNITCRVSKDGGAWATTNDTAEDEVGGSGNGRGKYLIDLAAGEMTADTVAIECVSATANTSVYRTNITTQH